MRNLTFLAVFAAYGIEPVQPDRAEPMFFHGAWSFQVRDHTDGPYVQAFFEEREPTGHDGLVAELDDPDRLDSFLHDTVRA